MFVRFYRRVELLAKEVLVFLTICAVARSFGTNMLFDFSCLLFLLALAGFCCQLILLTNSFTGLRCTYKYMSIL